MAVGSAQELSHPVGNSKSQRLSYQVTDIRVVHIQVVRVQSEDSLALEMITQAPPNCVHY